MTRGPVDGAMADLSYDAYNRLVKVETADGKITRYVYDAEDIRIRAEHTQADGSTWEETFVTDRETTYSRLLLAETDSGTAVYTYGLGLSSVSQGAETSYYHYNHLGSTTAITDSDGKVTTRVSYGTYGELAGITDMVSGKQLKEQASKDSAELRFLYNGQYGVQTEGNSLYYMRARYYSQDMRRFVNLDVVKGDLANTQSLNRYIFVQGNPVRATDPLGLSPEEGRPSIDKHTILGILGCIPFVGAAFSAYDAYLYYKEGNYPMMAACIVGTVANVCGTGGAVTQGLAKSGIIGSKTASTIMKALTATAVGAEVGYAGWQFGNSISKAIDEAREDGTISSATLKEAVFNGVVCAATTALGVGTMKRASSSMLKQKAKDTTPDTPTTTGATGTAVEVLEDGASGRNLNTTKNIEEISSNQPQYYVEDLRGVTGKGAKARQKAIEAIIREDFPDLHLTYKPEYSPFIRTGIAKHNTGTQIGKNMFVSRNDLRDTIIHEELHHRWWKKGKYDHHPIGTQNEKLFYDTIRRYKEMRGWN